MYVIRAIFSGMALIILAVSDAICNTAPGNHMWLLLAGAAYPHLGHLMLGRFDVRRRRGHLIFIVDGLFFGAVVAALQLAPIPSIVLATINLFNWMIVGGATLIALGSTSMIAGLALVKAPDISLLSSHATSCTAPDWLAGAVLVGYFLIVARVIHQLVDEMRQQQGELQTAADTASNAQYLAEGALLAVLPPSIADIMSEKGEVPTLTFDAATLLLVELDWDRPPPPSVSELADAFLVCDTILRRHGFELVKTLGRRGIALSRIEEGPDAGIASSQEIINYFNDHHALAGITERRRTVRLAMHHGPVTCGLIQPERMNLELTGETAEGLLSLASIIQELPPGAMVVSPAAQRKLHSNAALTLQPGNDRYPPYYLKEGTTTV